MLRVALPADTPPDVRGVFDEVARRIDAQALVQFTVVARLPDDVPFQVQLTGWWGTAPERAPGAGRDRLRGRTPGHPPSEGR